MKASTLSLQMNSIQLFGTIVTRQTFQGEFAQKKGTMPVILNIFLTYDNSYVAQLQYNNNRQQVELYHFTLNGAIATYPLKRHPLFLHQFKDNIFVISYGENAQILDLKLGTITARFDFREGVSFYPSALVFEESQKLCFMHVSFGLMQLEYLDLNKINQCQQIRKVLTFTITKGATRLEKVDEYSKVGIYFFEQADKERTCFIQYFDEAYSEQQLRTATFQLIKNERTICPDKLDISAFEVVPNQLLVTIGILRNDRNKNTYRYVLINTEKNHTVYNIEEKSSQLDFLKNDWLFKNYGNTVLVWDQLPCEENEQHHVISTEKKCLSYLSSRKKGCTHNSRIKPYSYIVHHFELSNDKSTDKSFFYFDVTAQLVLKQAWMQILLHINDDFDDDLLMDAIELLQLQAPSE